MVGKLLKLHFMQKRGGGLKGKRAFSFVLPALFLAVALAVLAVSLYVSARSFDKLRFGKEFVVFSLFLMQCVLTVFAVSKIIRELYLSDDNLLLLKLPVPKIDIYLSKIVFVFLNQLAVGFLFMAATVGMYGIVSAAGAGYWIFAAVVLLLVTFLSLGLGGALSVPVMYAVAFLKKRNFLKLLTVAVCLVLFFIGYFTVMNGVVSVIELTGGGGYIDPGLVETIRSYVRVFVVSDALADMIFLDGFVWGLAAYLPATVAVCAVSYFLAKKTYFKLQVSAIEYSVRTHPHKNKKRSRFAALFRREVFSIFRNNALSLHYFITAFMMPVMVYATASMAAAAGAARVGDKIIFGVCVLTLVMFLVMSDSSSASAVSRDANADYIGCILPVRRSVQLMVKIFVGLVLAMIPLLLSLVVLAASGYLSPAQACLLFAVLAVFAAAHNMQAVCMDEKRPLRAEYTNNCENTQNVFSSMAIGIFFAFLMGLPAIFMPFAGAGEWALFLCLAVPAVVYAAAVLLLYRKILFGRRS